MPYLLIAPMLSHDVSRIVFTVHVVNGHVSRRDGLTDTVERQCMVTFVQFRMRNGRTVTHRFVISEDVTRRTDGDAKVAEGSTEINNLIDAGLSGNEFRNISSRFDGRLLLGIPVNWCLVERWRIPVTERPVSMS